MEISGYVAQNLSSIKSAINMSTMQKAMNKDAQTMGKLIENMKETSAKVMESSITPHKGTVIDIRL
jgi:hypothetical protein